MYLRTPRTMQKATRRWLCESLPGQRRDCNLSEPQFTTWASSPLA